MVNNETKQGENMITKTINLYTFQELPKDVQTRVLTQNRTINVDYDGWCEHIDEDANNVGLEIDNFDIWSRHLDLEFTKTPLEVAELIIKNHGTARGTYLLAQEYIKNYKLLPQDEDDTPQEDAITLQFENDLRHEYVTMLKTEYHYLTTDEAVIEELEANEYYFNEKGQIETL